ncbi:MAG: peptide chain release factor N(5)-glutamine methyltransferase [Bacteroidia bacterium]
MQTNTGIRSDVIKFYKQELADIYTQSEIQNITNWILEKQLKNGVADIEGLKRMCNELKAHKPIQYVLGEAEFYRLQFKVNESVLIPRPETEELVERVIQSLKPNISNLNILDIGTGSGCIPISIKKNISQAKVYALDVSKDALEIAKYNAVQNNVEVNFFLADILSDSIEATILQHTKQEIIDLIISNPPYVLVSEKEGLHNRVKNYEPSLALYVDDNDPILFYRRIAALAKNILTKNGMLYFECHKDYAQTVYKLLMDKKFSTVCLHQDMTSVNRFVSATL